MTVQPFAGADYALAARRAALPQCPVAITINVDVETADLENSGGRVGLFGKYSYGRYGLREGFWRLLAALRAEGVPATWFVAPDDAERHPGMVEEILAAGHEVAALGRILSRPDAEGPGDLAAIARARAVLDPLTGAVRGWRSVNGLVTQESMASLIDQGFTYESCWENDDFPYVFADAKGGRLVELPVFNYLTDQTFYGAFHGPARVAKVWREEFEAMYQYGGYINLTLNQHGDYGTARAPRVDAMAEFLNHMGKRPGVEFMRGSEIAERLNAAAVPAERLPGNLPVPITL